MRMVVLPGVFRPRSDSWQLARAACAEPLPAGARILELCAGTGVAGVAAARHHRAALTVVDIDRRAVANAWLNGALNGIRVRGRRGDLLEPVDGERFDLVLANPPYLPGPRQPRRGPERAWNAGADGRALLDRICADAPARLSPGGVLLLVQSEVADPAATLAACVEAGLEVDITAPRIGPLGPLLRARRPALEARGLLPAGQATEEIVIVRGRAPRPSPGRDC